MAHRALASLVAALAASRVVSGQTFTDCNPMEKDCPPDPALGRAVTCDFRRGKCEGFEALAGTTITYDDEGAVFTTRKSLEASTMVLNKFILFGRVEFEVRCAPGTGVITAAILQSHNLDEADFEWRGGDAHKVQTNYFGKGNTTTYDRGRTHAAPSATTSFHKYAMEWTRDKLEWFVDGASVRVLRYAEAQGGAQFPQTPMQVRFGTWVPRAEGSQVWAGGRADPDKAPFVAHFRGVSVVDYAGGMAPAQGGVREYVYGDRSGRWESIVVVRDEEECEEDEECEEEEEDEEEDEEEEVVVVRPEVRVEATSAEREMVKTGTAEMTTAATRAEERTLTAAAAAAESETTTAESDTTSAAETSTTWTTSSRRATSRTGTAATPVPTSAATRGLSRSAVAACAVLAAACLLF